MTAQQFDQNLGDILQNVRQIDNFLDVVFEFLYRRTDFYRTMRDDKDTMGLPPGMARRLVMQAFMKYEQMAKIPSAEIQQGPAPSMAQEVEVGSDEKAKGEGSSQQTKDPSTGSVSNEKAKEKDSEENVTDMSKTKPSLTPADTYNGALRDAYAWSQTLKDVDIKVFVPSNIKTAKQLSVEIKAEHIKVATKDPGGPTVLLEAKVNSRINTEESMWSLDPGKYVQINLEKRTETWWKHAIEGEPDIDSKSIDNTQHIHEMDEESQSDYRRVMYDFEQKRHGKPSSKELETQDMLKKAWNAEGSPFRGAEFDPTKFNISTG
ncbi:nudC domain-containing protein 3-like [Amphiura filiformis]|uniref:nudC domain-containing protein 3-like n=1 Tax=Amphiura filiformis TaxID=82378 RepID=UPI003B216E16